MFSWSISSGLQRPMPQLSASASMMGRRSSRCASVSCLESLSSGWAKLSGRIRGGHYGASQAAPPRLIAAALHEPQRGEVRAERLALLTSVSHSP